MKYFLFPCVLRKCMYDSGDLFSSGSYVRDLAGRNLEIITSDETLVFNLIR
jgi:hypothetical protein